MFDVGRDAELLDVVAEQKFQRKFGLVAIGNRLRHPLSEVGGILRIARNLPELLGKARGIPSLKEIEVPIK